MKVQKKQYLYQSPFITICFVTAFTVLIGGAWVWFTRNSWGSGRLFKGIGSGVGVLGYTLFAFSLLLSSRYKKLEDWIGGLDRIYDLHHKLGIWGFCLLVAHPWILAIKWLPQHIDRFFLFIFPFHHRFAVNLGSYAFWLMLIIIALTIFKLLPYDKWKLVHKLMTVVFILASLHFLFSSRRFSPSLGALIPLFIPMLMGLFGIIYKQLWMPLFYPYLRYVVTDTCKISDNVMQIMLKPETKVINFIPGQYAFFSFREGVSKEQHPFTICHSQNSTIAIYMKVRGDYTRHLYEKLKKGTHALLEGPYGRFDYRRSMKDQIWLAGGIGIVPFLSWCQTIEKWEGRINLFYCVHSKKDILFLKEFKELQEKNRLFNFHIYCSENNQNLKIENIINVIDDLSKIEIFMCGPKKLTGYFLKKIQEKGVKRRNVHFEDFEFLEKGFNSKSKK